MGIHVGRDNLHRYLRDFGFGQRTGIGLPGESAGILNSLGDWTKGSLYYVSIGHEVSTTTIQLARAVSVFANGGLLVTPRLVLGRQKEDGDLEFLPEGPKKRILRAATATEVRRISEGVIHSGTGKLAKLEGFTAGGKTGTAQLLQVIAGAKPAKGKGKPKVRYGKRYAASFMGYAPLQNPRIVVVVTLNGASKMAGAVAAPVFKQVTEKALRQLEVEPDVPGVADPRPAGEAEEPQQQETPTDLPKPSLPQIAREAPKVGGNDLFIGRRVPDFKGKAKPDVLRESAALGMPVEMVGVGLARAQYPAAGSVLLKGEAIRVQFAR